MWTRRSGSSTDGRTACSGPVRFVDACLDRIADPWLRAQPPVGSVDQLADSADVLAYPRAFRAVRELYDTWAAADASNASGSSASA